MRVTYNSGEDGNYLSKTDQIKDVLPILQKLMKQLGVTNGVASAEIFTAKLPSSQLSAQAA